MEKERFIIGVDAGSVAVSIARISTVTGILDTDYIIHHGNLHDSLKQLLERCKITENTVLSMTSSVPDIISGVQKYDNQVAIITAAKKIHKDIRSLLNVGGEKFSLTVFDNEGNYRNVINNTSCAAGTGSFLDQQAKRLNLADTSDLSKRALENKEEIPKIASRCAVFAKTDLIHAQQEGFTLPAICDGLCHGLAKNIADVLFTGEAVEEPLVVCGGVSLNKAVLNHIEGLSGKQLIKDDYSYVYGAIGAAFCLAEDLETGRVDFECQFDGTPVLKIEKPNTCKRDYYYRPLKLELSDYPDFSSVKKYDFHSDKTKNNTVKSSVEVDLYEELDTEKKYSLYLGIDIGSTSTKAVLTGLDRKVYAGFYTATAGNPLAAIQSVFEAADDLFKTECSDLEVLGCSATGSGRKFVGKIVGAELIIDEITAHAKAAYELNPDVDTIIEIGGQDAKFTTMKNGMVTSSVMNNVCAAGTGSFIEEQAKKLGCTVYNYAEKAENANAPASSDRCTVFMERDLNHFLSEEYHVDELLASVLHSVRENYLLKVATEKNIGDVILFQGATARNRALVAAFEHKLSKPIIVSKYCHLTGAIGAALNLMDEGFGEREFRGIEIYNKDIPLTHEVCQMCNNNCKIIVADIDDHKVAYGFLCGRDYESKGFVTKNSSGFDLIKKRRKIFKVGGENTKKDGFSIGIPAGLHLMEDTGFWKTFFENLSIPVHTSENYKDALRSGKKITGAEFCAPVTAMYGHADYLLDKADYVFLPFYLEKKVQEKKLRRHYCYYTQFIPSLISHRNKERFLTPVIRHLQSDFYTKTILYRMLNDMSRESFSFLDVSSAFDKAREFKKTAKQKLKQLFLDELEKTDDVSVVLVGRPYTILSPASNSGIPGIFASLGIKTFFQDMLEDEKTDNPASDLTDELHWEYAAQIIASSVKIAEKKGVYPVFMTSFKCTPDAFTVGYFKEIMESYNKPYLVLELDEHDSSIGYETRIEAAVRTFRNHEQKKKGIETRNLKHLFPKLERNMDGKTIVLPNWDAIACRFLSATLKREGYETYLSEETDTTIKESLKFNTGQCIPLNAIATGFIDCMKKNQLDPDKTVLWLSRSEIACNIKMYPYHIKKLLAAYDKRYENAGVYVGSLSFIDISLKAAMNSYLSYLISGLLKRTVCKIRPYEKIAGETDRVLQKSIDLISSAFSGSMRIKDAVDEVITRLKWIETEDMGSKPKVAIFGDMYSRDNDVFNQDLIRFIELHGGEVITTPYSQYCRMIADTYFRKWFTEGKYLDLLSGKTLLSVMGRLDRSYFDKFNVIMNETYEVYDIPAEKILSEYNISVKNTGETMDNILKVFYIKEHNPDVALFVQASPAFCCPSIITEAMRTKIEENTGVPVLPITYDGTAGNKNDLIIPFLRFMKQPGKKLSNHRISKTG